MSRMIQHVAILALLFPALAAAETTISYQGQLEADGEPADETVDMTFELFDDPEGGSSVAGPIDVDGVEVSGGLFQVDLDFGAGTFDGQPLFLAIEVDGEVLEPRQRITAAPMALHAPDTSGQDSPWTVDGNDIHFAEGNVGIGTDMPEQPLHVADSILTGGPGNEVSGLDAAVVGGNNNEAHQPRSAVVAGAGNIASSGDVFVGGGLDNIVNAFAGAIVGGRDNSSNAIQGALVGGEDNTVGGGGENAFVGGGKENEADGQQSGVVAGDNVTAGGNFSFAAGGGNNTAGGTSSVLLGGFGVNVNDSQAGAIGGFDNSVNGINSVVAGGENNSTDDNNSFIGGGINQSSSGENTFIAGGRDNQVEGDNSLAAGSGARALHDNTFVWSGGGEERGVESTAENQFVVAASGSVQFLSDEDRSMGVELAPGGSGWSVVSDRDAKTAIDPADPADVLDRVTELEISEYSYKSQDETIRHMGPMAQDFHPLFGLGEDELRVSAMNLAGISLAAIQGLKAELGQRDDRLEEQERRIARLEEENAELRELAERNAELEDRLAQLEDLLLEGREVAEKNQ